VYPDSKKWRYKQRAELQRLCSSRCVRCFGLFLVLLALALHFTPLLFCATIAAPCGLSRARGTANTIEHISEALLHCTHPSSRAWWVFCGCGGRLPLLSPRCGAFAPSARCTLGGRLISRPVSRAKRRMPQACPGETRGECFLSYSAPRLRRDNAQRRKMLCVRLK
jgi:hypothetical protein